MGSTVQCLEDTGRQNSRRSSLVKRAIILYEVFYELSSANLERFCFEQSSLLLLNSVM